MCLQDTNYLIVLYKDTFTHVIIFFVLFIANGYQNVRFHVDAQLQNLQHFCEEDEIRLRKTVANIVGCEIEEVFVKGYLPSTSFFVVLSMKCIYVQTLLLLNQHGKDELSKLNIDFFKVGPITHHVKRSKGDLWFHFISHLNFVDLFAMKAKMCTSFFSSKNQIKQLFNRIIYF